MVRTGVRAENIVASGPACGFLRPRRDERRQARPLGVDALHFNDGAFAREACSLHGAEALLAALHDCRRAIALAGSEAFDILGLSVEQLLQLCAGSPKAATAVLAAEEARGLAGVRASTLLDTGLRAGALKALGIGMMHVSELEGAECDTGLKFNFKL